MSRIKLNQPAIKTRAQMEATLADIRDATLKRNQLQLESETRKKAIDDDFAPRIDQLNQLLEEKADLLRSWSEANPAEFHGLKSLETTHGALGWRIGQVTLKTLAGYTWDRVLEKLKDSPRWKSYIRTKDEVNKQAILVDRETIPPDELRAVGVRVVQEEKFFVEPNIEEQANAQTIAT